MITRDHFTEFFDLEAEATAERFKAMMSLSLQERIRKRKAINNLYLDKEYKYNDDNYERYKLHVSINLSDFKEGENLLLHDENQINSIKCTLYQVDDEIIYIRVYPPELPFRDIHSIFDDKPLVLDKDAVDLRDAVYNKFVAQLSVDDDFWRNHILNTHKTPSFDLNEKYEAELKETEENFKFHFTKNQREALLKSMQAEDYYLIQGPPGTGKSFLLSLIILEELVYFKRKVVVIGPNHKAVNNVLEQVLRIYPTIRYIFKVGQTYNAPTGKVERGENTYEINNIEYLNVSAVDKVDFVLLGMTPHSLYTSRANYLEFNTLIIDEAGQMTIPLAMMGMINAKKVILAGDHKQLAPIIASEKVSDVMKQSIFQLLITEDNCTLLDVSFRMCETICNFVSDLFYEGRVKSMAKDNGKFVKSSNKLYSFDYPVILHNVEDDGEQYSDKEAEETTNIIANFVKMGLSADDMAVLTPFRAQAANIRHHLGKCDSLKDISQSITVDTIDRMQGQERKMIILSLTAGNLDYMIDMGEFLYNPNKLNVAFSRAKSKLVIMGNVEQLKKLSEIEYPHIHKMINSKYIIFA